MQFPRLKAYGKAIYQSFYHPPLYRDVIWTWKGFGGSYMMLLALLMGFVMAVGLGFLNAQFKENTLPHILAQVPNMVVEDGHLLVQALQQPVQIDAGELGDLKEKGMLLAYINTLETEEQLAQQQGKAMIIMGYESMFILDSKGYTKKSYQKFNQFRITPKMIQQNWPGFFGTVVFFTIVLTFGLTLNMLVLSILVAVCSYLVTAFMREEYDFETRMRMAAIAITPPLLLSKLLLLAANHATETWFDILLSVFYVYVMIVSSRKLQPVPQA